MRDKRFVAEHLVGPLKKEQHIQLIKGVCRCTENVLHLIGEKIDNRLLNAIIIANEWAIVNETDRKLLQNPQLTIPSDILHK